MELSPKPQYPRSLSFNAWPVYIAASEGVYQATRRAARIDYSAFILMLSEYMCDNQSIYADRPVDYLCEHGVDRNSAHGIVKFCLDELIEITSTFTDILADSRRRRQHASDAGEDESDEPLIEEYSFEIREPRYRLDVSICWSHQQPKQEEPQLHFKVNW